MNWIFCRVLLAHEPKIPMKTSQQNPIVLCVGVDLRSNGGIAHVVGCYYREWEARPCGFEYQFLRTNHYMDKPFYREPFAFFGALVKMVYYLLCKNVVLLHVHSSFGWSFLRKSIIVFIASLFGKPVALHIHTGRIYSWFLSENRLLRAITDAVFRRSDVIIVLCRDWKKRLQRRYPSANIVVLENPFNSNDIASPVEKTRTDFRVLFCGFLLPAKGVEDLVAVAERAAAEGVCDIRFVIAGRGEMEPYILEYIAGAGARPNVEYVGWITGDRKTQTLASASLFFLPSYIEGMPTSILEAMSHGLPIVSTKISGVPDLVADGENGYLFQPGDRDGFYAAIKRLHFDRPLRERMGRFSKKRSRQFASDIVYGKLQDIYYHATDGKIGSPLQPASGESGFAP